MNDKLSYETFKKIENNVNKIKSEKSYLRLGQIWFNETFKYTYKVTDLLNTDKDPFFQDDNIDRFIDYIFEKNS